MERLLRSLLGRPGVVVVLLTAATTVSAAYLPLVRLKTDTASLAPKDDPVIEELEEATEDFGSQDIMMVVLKGEVFTPAALARAAHLATLLSRVPGIDEVLTPLDAQVIRGDEFGLQISPVADRVPETPAKVDAFRKALAASRQGSAMVAKGRDAIAIFLTLEPHIMASQRAQTLAGEVEAIVRREKGPGVDEIEETYIVGEAYMGYSASRNMRRDLRILMPLAVAVVIATLYLSFRSTFDVAAIMGGIVMSLAWTIGLMAALGHNLTLVSMILPIILVSMGSAAGIHIINRFREEGASARTVKDVKDAIVKVVLQLTGPIAMTNLTTAVGFASFVTSFLPPVREFGAFAAAGIVFNMLITLTWIPAVLVLRATQRAASGASVLVSGFGASSSPPRPAGRRLNVQRGLEALGRLTIARPWPIIGGAILLTLAFALGIPNVRVETNFREYFRKDSPFAKGTRIVEDLFGGTLSLSVVVDSGVEDGIKDPALLARMLELESKMGTVGSITHPSSVASVVREVNKALHGGNPAYYTIPNSREAVAQELLLFSMQGGDSLDSMVSYDFRKALISARITNMPTSRLGDTISAIEALAGEALRGSGAKAVIVGLPKVMLRLMSRFMDSQIRSLAFSAVGVWLVVALITRSALLGLLCLVALCISVVVNFGLMAFAGIPLDVVTIMISGICIGIGIDYSIHFLSRYRLELRAGKDKDSALACTVYSTGRGILFNAATLMLGFGLLVFSGFKAISVFGLLVATAMLTSAMGAMVVLPAVLRVMSGDLVSRVGLASRRKRAAGTPGGTPRRVKGTPGPLRPA